MKSTWKIIMEVVCSTKNKLKDLPEKLVINNATVVEKQEIAENLNKFFTNTGSNLGSKILNEPKYSKKYLANCNTVISYAQLTNGE